jgi:hypothetical protein
LPVLRAVMMGLMRHSRRRRGVRARACACVRACACARACVRAFACACARARVRACACVTGEAYFWLQGGPITRCCWSSSPCRTPVVAPLGPPPVRHVSHYCTVVVSYLLKVVARGLSVCLLGVSGRTYPPCQTLTPYTHSAYRTGRGLQSVFGVWRIISDAQGPLPVPLYVW